MESRIIDVLDIKPMYEINDMGIIRNIKTGRVLSYFYSDGYAMVSLNTIHHGRRTFKVHKLVALMFLPPPPTKEHIYIHHINHNRADPSEENLKWVTPTENNLDRWPRAEVILPHSEGENNFGKGMTCENNGFATHTNKEMLDIARLSVRGYSTRDAIVLSGHEYTPQLADIVNRMKRGERWKAVMQQAIDEVK